jgi:hypothetical protein
MEALLDQRISAFKSLEKSPADGFGSPLISKSQKSGASASLVVYELTQLTRSLILREQNWEELSALKRQASVSRTVNMREQFM